MSNEEIKDNLEENIVEVQEEETHNQPNPYIEKAKLWLANQNKSLLIAIAAIILLVGGYFLYQYLYKKPLEKRGLVAIYKTQALFDKDSFNLVLKTAPKLAEEYSGTLAGNQASYMAGASCLNTGNFDKAIQYLSDVKFTDKIMKAQAIGLLGDAYMEKKDISNALKYYKKAAEKAKADFAIVWWNMKVAKVLQKQNDWKGALEIYENLKDNFSPETEGLKDIDKYIARAQATLGDYQ